MAGDKKVGRRICHVGRPNPAAYYNIHNGQRKKFPIEEFDYLDELVRLEEESSEVIRVPANLAKQVGYQLIRPHVFIDDPWSQMRREFMWSVGEGRAVVKRANLVKYLFEGSQGPCYCGSGRKYEKCHAREDLPALRGMILQMNGGRE